jgi:hypothetical protein
MRWVKREARLAAPAERVAQLLPQLRPVLEWITRIAPLHDVLHPLLHHAERVRMD